MYLAGQHQLKHENQERNVSQKTKLVSPTLLDPFRHESGSQKRQKKAAAHGSDVRVLNKHVAVTKTTQLTRVLTIIRHKQSTKKKCMTTLRTLRGLNSREKKTGISLTVLSRGKFSYTGNDVSFFNKYVNKCLQLSECTFPRRSIKAKLQQRPLMYKYLIQSQPR